jgi:hypothetical protein
MAMVVLLLSNQWIMLTDFDLVEDRLPQHAEMQSHDQRRQRFQRTQVIKTKDGPKERWGFVSIQQNSPYFLHLHPPHKLCSLVYLSQF